MVLNEAGVDIDITETIKELEGEMLAAANNLEFEKAALMRDQIRELKRALNGEPATKQTSSVSYKKGRSGGRKTAAK
jgi:excinuclease ABC subunit B